MYAARTLEASVFSASQHFHLMQGVSESLAGRVAVMQLLGVVRDELAGDRRRALLQLLACTKTALTLS